MADEKTVQELEAKNTGKLAEGKPSEDHTSTPEPKKGVFTGFSLAEKRKSDGTERSPVKIGFKSKATMGISIKLGAPEVKKKKVEPVLQKKKGSVAAAFNDDESDEEEEMPPEAKMRMRNVGKDTPTSAGPNSFNKGKKGFIHHHKLFEKELKDTKPPS